MVSMKEEIGKAEEGKEISLGSKAVKEKEKRKGNEGMEGKEKVHCIK